MNKLRKILFPFAVLYDGVTRFRNILYDKGILKSEKYDVPVIVVGNLNVGGTGKSPMIEFLIKQLSKEAKVAVLSRGYKRKTKGFIEVQPSHTALEVGDEPLQFKKKFLKVTIAVDANRRNGISKLKQVADVILLDDAFQHRKVQPSFSILLTAYNHLYTEDLLLPAGNLRETVKESRRANCVVVTKCPENLTAEERQSIVEKLKTSTRQPVFFTTIRYGETLQNASESIPISALANQQFTLITGIANPKPLVAFLKKQYMDFDHLDFPDHHHFSVKELQQLNAKPLLITTEKDFVRLESKISTALYYLPIEVSFVEREEEFVAGVVDVIKSFK